MSANTHDPSADADVDAGATESEQNQPTGITRSQLDRPYRLTILPPDAEEELDPDAEDLLDINADATAGSTEPADDAAAPRPRDPRDPVALCAAILLRRALRSARDTLATAQLIVLQVPSEAWITQVADAWQHCQQQHDGADATRRHAATGRSVLDHPRPEYRLIKGHEAESQTTQNAIVTTALIGGMTVIGVSHDPARLLPQALVAAPDLSLTLPPPDPATLRQVARLLTGHSPNLRQPMGSPAHVTPDQLRLACRRQQTPEAWLRRLAKLTVPPSAAPSGLSLDQLSGMDAVVTWGKSLARDLADYRAHRLRWQDVDPGALLVGLPGVGKTMAARAIAVTCGVPFLPTSYAEWQAANTGHLGDLMQAMHGVFADARAQAPCVVFIDELDSLPSRRSGSEGGNSSWWRSVVNALLEHLCGKQAREGVVVIGATNFANLIDPALCRSGRFDRQILIPRPDVASLVGILRFHLHGALPRADLTATAARLEARGATGADVERLVREARQRARHAERPLTEEDLRDVLGPLPPEPPLSFRRQIAVHEAGHVLITSLQTPGQVARVSINAHGGFAGWTQSHPKHSVLTREQIAARLRELLAGRAAEQILLDAPSIGAGGAPESDLARATLLARATVCSFGLGRRAASLMWRETPTDGEWPLPPLAPALEAEVQQMLAAAYRRCLKLVRQHRAAVEALAERLMAAGEMDGAEAEALIRQTNRGGIPTGNPP